MKVWKFRVVAPEKDKTDWVEWEAEQDWVAIQAWHFANTVGVSIRRKGSKETETFAKFELEDGTRLVSRIFTSGIYRRGGVQPPATGYSDSYKLSQLAKVLSVSIDTLAPDNWVGEEEEY
jgi:hypothetical protein